MMNRCVPSSGLVALRWLLTESALARSPYLGLSERDYHRV